ncbi:tripartite tricarboxylate transporter substrate binding protein [Aureimonas altamirensis]|uniref:Bug family tripartite tricarboxylate transporter substrate binding protein n=1 Tax=Aureimonas altamirensis TaxID=370622 RepID=UPI0020370606|nr:tripartite tricarboxylate transporter substrate binding protein [Aureimonas altamirensis]MCM2505396.1 tripartite tricarboxylate transporter substrate binding protein [Aureimonas altamirensis]
MHALLNRRGLLRMCAALCLVPALGAPTFAQDALPSGPITIVVPFAAGGATDVVGRLVAGKLSTVLGHTVLVENVGGAGGSLGAAQIANAAPDGTRLLMGTVATHAISPLITKPAQYDPKADFTPISLLARVPNVLLVAKDSEIDSVAELIEFAKADPDAYLYGSSGIGTPPHLSGELFNQMAGTEMVHVPYAGGGPAMTDLIGGQIPVLFDVLTGAASFIQGDAVKPLAVTTAERSAAFPDIPTVAESGLPGYETYTWNAIFGPAGLPQPLVDQLNTALVEVMKDPEIQRRLEELSAIPVGSTAGELADLVDTELAKWGPVVEQAHLQN